MSDPVAVGNDRVAEMQVLRAQGETLAEIGARFGLSAERVRQTLLAAGFPTRDGVMASGDDIARTTAIPPRPRTVADAHPILTQMLAARRLAGAVALPAALEQETP